MFFVSEAQSALIPDNNQVRVRLKTFANEVQISGVGLKFQNVKSPFRQVAIPDAKSYKVRLLEKDGHTIWALRQNNQEREHLFTEKFLFIQGANVRVGGESLPNQILLSQNDSDKVDVVGVMSLEDYIVGVIASEVPLSWPLETLKAQAVAARSYAIAVMADRRHKAYHLESNVLDQVFRHVVGGDSEDPLIKKAIQAVQETRSEKLVSSRGRVLKAFYHADCGGSTVTAKDVWKYGVNSGTTVDSSCAAAPRGNWTLKLNRKEIAQKMGLNNFSDMEFVQARGPRVHSVRFLLPDGSSQLIAANDFRSKLGFQNLRSTLFDLKKDGDRFVFVGKGFGHGVGLCQWGSRAMGKSGQSYKQILAHYYPLAQLKQ